MKVSLIPKQLINWKFLRNSGIASLVAASSLTVGNIAPDCKNLNKTFSTTAALLAGVGLSGIFAGKYVKKREYEAEIINNPIKELTDEEFENLKKEIEKKKRGLSVINQKELDFIELNKVNAQIINKIINKNKDFSKFYPCYLRFDNINSARFLNYLLKNKKNLPPNFQNLILGKVHKTIKTKEDLDFKIKFLEDGIKNPKIGKNFFFQEILENATSLEEAYKWINYSQAYGILPYTKTKLIDKFGEKFTNNMLSDVHKIKKQFNLKIDDIVPSEYSFATPQKFFCSNNGLKFLVNRKTGKVICFEKDDTIYNLKNKIFSQVSSPVIELKNYDFYTEECLVGGKIETKDFNNNFINQSEFCRSKVNGEFDVYANYTDKIGLGEFDKNKGKHVEKHFTSLDGTTTDYIFASDKKGNRYFLYKITDKSNNILYKSKKKFKVLSRNHFQSTTDGITYDILFQKDKVVVTKLNGPDKTVEYQIKKYTTKDYEKFNSLINSGKTSLLINPKLIIKQLPLKNKITDCSIKKEYSIDKKFVNVLKNLAGEEWFALRRSGVSKLISDISNNTARSILGKGIQVGTGEIRLSTFEHEIGHDKAHTLQLERDETLLKIYQQEKDLFITSLPEIAAKQAEYFLEEKSKLGLAETAAETNLLINIPQDDIDIGSRTLFLQQYFPKTIAYIANRYRELY